MSTPEPTPESEKAEKQEKVTDGAEAKGTPQPESSSHDAGSAAEGISAAAANPGSTAARDEEVRRARERFMRFDGPTTLRDAINTQNIFTIGGVTAHVTGIHQWDDTDIAERCETFVPPSQAKELDAHVVVLRGAAGSGKPTAAVSALAEHVNSIFQFGPATPLGTLSIDGLKTHAGYLLDDLPAESASSLRSYDLERLEAEFRRLESRLVITVRPEVVFADAAIDRYLVDLGERPDIRLVFESHLRWHLAGEDQALANQLLSRTDLRELLDAELTAQAALQKAADLARLTADHRREPDRLVIAVRQRLSRSDDIDFAGWFDALVSDLRLLCSAISLAVFNGMSYETVARGGTSLYRTFRSESGQLDRRAVKPFGDGRASRLAKLRARVVDGRIRYHRTGNVVPAEIVEYTDPSFSLRVLHQVWKEHDGAREGLLTWLREFGSDTDPSVRVRAATAIGELTVIAYQHLRGEVLESWADSDNSCCWESAAIAMTFAADAGLAGALSTLARRWSLGDGNKLATAARVYGMGIAEVPLVAALAKMRRLAEADAYDTRWAVAEGLLDLVGRCDQDKRREILETIQQWSVDRNANRRFVAKCAFLLMAIDLETVHPDGRKWPSLLWLAHSQRELRQLLSELWAASLNAADTAEAALVVVNHWATSLDGDQTAREAFVALLHDACITPRVAARLRKHVRKWLKPYSEIASTNTARDLLAVLPQEG